MLGFAGVLLIALPLLSLVLLVIGTGHQVQPGWETLFFGAAYFCFFAGWLTVPLGILLLIVAAIIGLRRSRRGPTG